MSGMNKTFRGAEARNVIPTPDIGVAQNRLIPSVAIVHPGDGTSNVATWTAGEDIHNVVIPPNCRYVINASSDADAKTLLDDAGGASTTVVFGETNTESIVFTQISVITQLDMKSVSGSNQTNVVVEAWS